MKRNKKNTNYSETQNNLFFDNVAVKNAQAITISTVYNQYTLNIFSDASMMKASNGKMYGCYGAICVVQDTIIDFQYYIMEDTTINECEISGIKLALSFAHKYKYLFQFINLYSDSLISVQGLREYIYNWSYRNNKLYSSGSKLVANQHLFVECYDMWASVLFTNPNVKIWHQSAHIDNRMQSIIEAGTKFAKYNSFDGSIDLNFITYISKYNNFIDNGTRNYLHQMYMTKCCTQPIKFFPTHHY